MPGEELVVPGIGELVSLDDENQCANALSALRDFEYSVREAKAILTAAIAERGRVLGTQTLTLEDGRKAVIKGSSETNYDAEKIEEGLRGLGMPEERIREIVVETVQYKVAAGEAKRAAAANEDYASVIDGAKIVIEKIPYVTIQR